MDMPGILAVTFLIIGISIIVRTFSACGQTLFAYSVENRPDGIHPEPVLLEQVYLYFLQFAAVQMYQLSAFLTFAVEAETGIYVAVGAHILKTGGSVYIDYVFIEDAFIHETFQLPVDGGLSYGNSLLSEILTYIAGGNMYPLYISEIFQEYFPLFCPVL